MYIFRTDDGKTIYTHYKPIRDISLCGLRPIEEIRRANNPLHEEFNRIIMQRINQYGDINANTSGETLD